MAFVSLVAFWSLAGKYSLLQGKLEDTKRVISQGPLVQPATEKAIYVTPDHAPGIDRARIKLSRAAPLLMDVHIDLGYTQKLMQFRLFVDKQDQGRALVLNNLLKDSNGELRVTLNSTGLSAGIYTVRIEALPPRGIPIPIGWLILEVQLERGAQAAQSSRSVTMGGVLITLRVASVPLKPTRTVPHTRPATHTNGSSVNCSENSRSANIHPIPVAPKAARVPDRKPKRRKFRGDALQHRAAARAQGPQHRALIAPLIPGRLHRRQQHDDSRSQRE